MFRQACGQVERVSCDCRQVHTLHVPWRPAKGRCKHKPSRHTDNSHKETHDENQSNHRRFKRLRFSAHDQRKQNTPGCSNPGNRAALKSTRSIRRPSPIALIFIMKKNGRTVDNRPKKIERMQNSTVAHKRRHGLTSANCCRRIVTIPIH